MVNTIDDVVTHIRISRPAAMPSRDSSVWARPPWIDELDWQTMITSELDKITTTLTNIRALQTANREAHTRAREQGAELERATGMMQAMQTVAQASLLVDSHYNQRIATVLTILATIFVPFGACTSIFSMSILPPDTSLRTFTLTTIGICIPVYVIVAGMILPRPILKAAVKLPTMQNEIKKQIGSILGYCLKALGVSIVFLYHLATCKRPRRKRRKQSQGLSRVWPRGPPT